jgi:glucokinase/kanosamine 6-kinase
LCARYPANVAQAHWLETAAEALAVCSANLVALFRTRRITLSGGLVQRFPTLHEAVARALRTSFLKRSLAMPEIAVSPYGRDASLYGALALAAAPEAQQRATGHYWAAR